jgi:hypothetical protein
MKRLLGCSLVVLWACSPLAHADATLVYELDHPTAGKIEKRLSLSRFFARIDFSNEEGRYLLFQAGKFFPLFSVDEKAGTYARLTPPVKARLGPESRTKASETRGREAEAVAEGALEEKVPQTPAPETGEEAGVEPPVTAEADTEDASAADEGDEPEGAAEAAKASGATAGGEAETKATPALAKYPRFEASAKRDEVAGIACRVVQEVVDDKPVVEHCMANKAALGITERETRTLARLFVLARQRGWDWLGAATRDEEFVSIRSRRVGGDGSLMLKSVSTEPLPAGHLRIPRSYKEVKPPRPEGG